MSTLPKIIYGGTRVGTVIYNGTEIFHIVEQSANGENIPIYHKHRGDQNHYGGCHTKSRTETETKTVKHNWNRTGRIRTDNFDGEVVPGEGSSHIITEIYSVTDEHGHTGELSWCSLATGARASMEHKWEFKSETYGNADGKSAQGAPLNFQTAKSQTVKVTYYDLNCGFDEEE